MACQKCTNRGGSKSEGKYTKLHPSLHLLTIQYILLDPLLFVYFLAHHLDISFIFTDFSFLFLGNFLSYVGTVSINCKCNNNFIAITRTSTDSLVILTPHLLLLTRQAL